MTSVDARVRVQHPCPYCDLSVAFPRSQFLLWCDNRRDVFLVSSPDPAELRDVLRTLRSSFRSRTLIEEERTALVELPEFEWTDPPSVTGLARRAGVWVLHPVQYADGRETYRLLAADRARLNRLFERLRRLGDVEILSVRPSAQLSTVGDQPSAKVHFFEGLTPPQVRSLLAAYEGGLLDVPSRASWAEVARRERLSRSTFGEHLRKAQRTLLANSYAALKLRREPVPAPIVLPALPTASRSKRSPLRGRRPRP